MEKRMENHMEHGMETEIVHMFIGMTSSVVVLDYLCH